MHSKQATTACNTEINHHMKKLTLIAVIAPLALMVSAAARADTVERCRINTAGDKVCEVRGKITERCHTNGAGVETCRRYGDGS